MTTYIFDSGVSQGEAFKSLLDVHSKVTYTLPYRVQTLYEVMQGKPHVCLEVSYTHGVGPKEDLRTLLMDSLGGKVTVFRENSYRNSGENGRVY